MRKDQETSRTPRDRSGKEVPVGGPEAENPCFRDEIMLQPQLWAAGRTLPWEHLSHLMSQTVSLADPFAESESRGQSIPRTEPGTRHLLNTFVG